ncbi:hypothetical protein AMK24_27740 [Streptomyces sp. CB02366]|nr:hypothetical protein AMK24_27740 [Streptomyces sp. CB02366]
MISTRYRCPFYQDGADDMSGTLTGTVNPQVIPGRPANVTTPRDVELLLVVTHEAGKDVFAPFQVAQYRDERPGGQCSGGRTRQLTAPV